MFVHIVFVVLPSMSPLLHVIMDFDFTKGGFDARTVMICDQCEREYHVGCLKDQGICDLKELPEGKWFCCVDCSMIHVTLQKLITNRAEMLSDSLLDIIKRKYEEKGLTMDSETGMQWQLLSGKAWHLNDGCLLSKANTMFHECFGPLLEQTGCDLISCMVEGKQMGDREYGGFYCAVLTVNSAIASAGLLRIFGQEVAELPLVATCNDSRGYALDVIFANDLHQLDLSHGSMLLRPFYCWPLCPPIRKGLKNILVMTTAKQNPSIFVLFPGLSSVVHQSN
ncbi:hypothetical protein AMTR_s00012p00102710 [Amborella trichopoda]|uniref:Increased DNA methylation 1 C-terminal domain-containing protein n=1 Tax=Amborella trichopoda TaxID=13333 RepID=W1PCY0_AMBTC|nr:hypothetical protein AMTR_s00012p00102710 [Amborella trichopoda]